MKKKLEVVNSPKDLPQFRSEAEEAEFWSAHTMGEDFFNLSQATAEDFDLPPVRPRTKPIAVRFDEDTVRRLKALALKKNKGYQTLLKEFVQERLYEEEKREGLVQVLR